MKIKNFTITYILRLNKGQSLVELLMAIGISTILLPAILTGFIASRNGKAQEQQRLGSVEILKETQEALRVIRENGWVNIATVSAGVPYHPVVSNNTWKLSSGAETINGLTRQIIFSSVYRATASGAIISGTNGWLDPSTIQSVITVSWGTPFASSISSTEYFTRYLDNLSFLQTTYADFSSGSAIQSQVTNTSGGEVTIANNTKAKWCSPAFSSASIDLPDGPPVAVSARSSATSSAVPNDAFVATSPTATNSVKLAYVNVTANTDPPIPTLHGTFTLDPTKYSNGSYVPTGLDLDNSFITNDVKYYTSTQGNLYALMATNNPTHEVVAIQVKNANGVNDSFQDPANKIYKYWTYFNTKIYSSASFTNPTANAADTGGDGNGFQTTPTNAYISDGSFATDSNSGNGTGTSCAGADKDKHRFYDYGFNIPTGATINGVAINLIAKADSTTGTPKMCVQLSWDGGTTWTAAETTANLTTSSATYSLGGSADTWGRTWANTDFSDNNFRVRVIDVASNTSRTFSLDWIGAKIYYNGISTTSNDQAPFGYGGASIAINGNTGYVDSSGYLYAFDLSNIDSKSPSNGLDQIGCRILLDGYDCKPNTGTDMKYAAGETGESWSDTASPAHNDCSDGGNIEINADHQLSTVSVGANSYVYVAVGAGTNPELDIVDTTTAPTGSNLTATSCGRGSDTGWKVTGNLDFDPASGTEEAANSVYAKTDGTRAYMSSNGGIIHNGISDSDQFYIIDTSNKSSPKFLSTWPSTVNGQHYINTAETGYYNATTSADLELYPRRALTVLNGDRAVLVGQDGLPNDGLEPHEYQVLNLSTEATPLYCGGLYYQPGFNDLTSVSEYDGDNFVYMVANTNQKQLKIIQGGADGTFNNQGTFTSSPINIGYSTVFNHYSANVTTPANTSVQFQFAGADQVNGSCANASYVFTGPDGLTSSYYATTSAAILVSTVNGYKNPARCFEYKAYFSTTDYNNTPVLNDITVNYSP